MKRMMPREPGAGGVPMSRGLLVVEGAELFRSGKLRRLSRQRRGLRALAIRPRLFSWAARPLGWFLSRRNDTAVVAGYDAVREVLRDGRSFPVPFGERFTEMDRAGANFILGMNQEAEYAPVHGEVMRAFRLEDVPERAREAGALAAKLVEDAAPRGRIDAMAGLLTEVPVRLVESYYGVEIEQDEREEFPLWTFAMSTYAFAGPMDEPQDKPAAMYGAKRLGEVVDRAVEAALSAANPDTTKVLGRLVEARQRLPDGKTLLDKDALRATMVGLITGFVPTCSKASANILAVLLDRPEARAAAEAAANAGDDELLARCLFEALRFRQTLPGIFRHSTGPRVLPGGERIREEKWVWALASLAAFDKALVERRWDFDPGRGEACSLGFGFGQHRCVGAVLARAQIAATFKPLLLRGRLRAVEGSDRDPTTFCTFVEHHHVAFGQGAPR